MRSGSRVVTVLLWLGCFLCFSVLAVAQSATSSLRGTVTDSKGAVIVGAAVTISDPATVLSHNIKTEAQGEYQFLEMPPATYELTVKAQGFATLKETGIK